MIRELSSSLGKMMYEFSVRESFPASTMLNLFAGTISGGFWLCFEHIDLTPLS